MIPLIKKPTRSRKRSDAVDKPDPIITIKNDGQSLIFVPLGGLEEVGRNCAFFEYKNEIIVIDVGIQFPEEETPGVDYIIPNISYLEGKKSNVKGIILTHGHYDHIHALPYLYDKMGSPIIYTASFTRHLIERRFQEFPNVSKPKFIVVKNGDKEKISENFTVEFFDISHTIPDALGICIDTPVGKMVNFGDFRLDTNQLREPINLETFERLGKMNIHSVFMDSTSSTREGFSLSEKNIEENLEKLFVNAEGRVIIGTFASLMIRIAEILKIADRLGRKVALNGRSMKDNVQIAMTTGYIKTRKDQIIPIEEIDKYEDKKIMIITTGAQGEPNAGLMKIVTGEHKTVHLKPTDTVIFSSSVVPGNERSVQGLQDNIARQVDEIYNSKLLDIHASGHAHSEDLKLVMKIVKPKFVVPVHGYYFMRKHTTKLAQSVGIPKENTILMDNGQVAVITKDSFVITKENVPSSYVMVDGLGVGDVGEIVLRDRRVLAQEGMVVIIATLDRHNGRLIKNPNIISRGFIYLRENQDLIEEIRFKLKGILQRIPHHQNIDPDYLKNLIRDQIGQFLFTKTKRRPMILPVLIEV